MKKSHPLRVGGLKLEFDKATGIQLNASHPLRVGGLKFKVKQNHRYIIASHPLRVGGLKLM